MDQWPGPKCKNAVQYLSRTNSQAKHFMKGLYCKLFHLATVIKAYLVVQHLNWAVTDCEHVELLYVLFVKKGIVYTNNGGSQSLYVGLVKT